MYNTAIKDCHEETDIEKGSIGNIYLSRLPQETEVEIFSLYTYISDDQQNPHSLGIIPRQKSL